MKSCNQCKNNFEVTPDDLNFYQKISVPEPTLCPQCRTIRRMMWWNEHNLYRKQGMFSTFPESSPITIMERDAWWGDGWDAMDYGREYDFTRPFFPQFGELLREVPWPSRDVQRIVNSDYSNQCSDLKNCYLCFNTGKSENCLYGVSSLEIRDSMDFYFCGKCELCYEVINAENCYATFFSADVGNCRNVWYSRDCNDCQDCFGCANLRSKQYYIFNEPYTKEEYKEKIKTIKPEDCYAFWKTQPYRSTHALQNTNSIGDYLYNSKNARYCYQVLAGENLAYCQNMSRGIKDSMDYTSWGNNAELIYESISCGESVRNLKFCMNCWPGSTDLEYCVNTMSSRNCFGCVGLRKKEYCILNRQYTPGEYAEQVAKIKAQMAKAGEYGEFFPASMSPLAYNESAAGDFFPKTKEAAESEGYLWREPETKQFAITPETPACATCGRAFRVLDREREFLQRFGLPDPTSCHRCRHLARLAWRNPMQWWKRACSKCGTDTETTNATAETLYCEACYQELVF